MLKIHFTSLPEFQTIWYRYPNVGNQWNRIGSINTSSKTGEKQFVPEMPHAPLSRSDLRLLVRFTSNIPLNEKQLKRYAKP